MMEPKLIKIEAVDVPDVSPEASKSEPDSKPVKHGRLRKFLRRDNGQASVLAAQTAGLG